MKKLLALLFLVPLALFAAEKNAQHCGCSCCADKAVCCCFETAANSESPAPAAKEDTNSDTAAARHPLRGVIVAVRAEKSALLVKHEAIPGYMRAMTMLFKVERTALASLKKGQAITGTLVERDDGFHLEDIKLAQ